MQRFVSVLLALVLVFSLIGICLTLPVLAQPDGLIAYYPFNGNANDESVNSHHGTVNGATLETDRFGNPNSAYRFNGINNYVQIPDHTDFDFGTEGFTVSAWIKTTATTTVGSGRDDIVAKGDPTISGYAISMRNNKAAFWVGSSGELFGNSVLNDGEWHHILGTRDDSNNIVLYVDGIAESSGINSESVDTDYSVFIGKHGTKNESYFDGLIDDVCVYDREFPPPSEVWVDDDWAGSSSGDVVDGHFFGYDAFARIQDGIDAVAGSIVYVADGIYTPIRPGEYQGHILISNKNDIELIGSGATTTIIQGDYSTSAVWVVNSTNILIKGFTIANGGRLQHDEGGGVRAVGSTLTIESCVITDNKAVNGGGVKGDGESNIAIVNSIITNNQAENRYGAVVSNGYIVCSTIVNNIGIYDDRGGVGGDDESLIVTNCIVWGNGDDILTAGTWPWDPTIVTYSNIEDGDSGEGNISSNPLFVDPSNNDYHLQSGSPCINAGSNAAVPGWLTIDFDGDPRILPVGGDVDMGADEYVPPTTVVEATIDVDPDTLNLKSKGKWITCYVELPDGYDVQDIDIGTVMLNETIPAERGNVQDGVLMVKFDRAEVQSILSPGDEIEIAVLGALTDGTPFEGADTIRVKE